MKKLSYKIVFLVEIPTLKNIFGKDFFVENGKQLSFEF